MVEGRDPTEPSPPSRCMGYAVLLVLAGILAVPAVSAQPIGGALRIEMVEFAFRPAVIRVTAGQPITLRLVNRGQIAHQFGAEYLSTVPVVSSDSRMRVEAPGIEALRLQPGESATIQFVPRQRGRFQFACTIEGHREAGMEGVLEVR